MFQHDDPNQGRIVSVKESPLEGITGKHQCWLYDVTYAGGGCKSFCVKSPGLPVRFLSATEITEHLKTIRRQPFEYVNCLCLNHFLFCNYFYVEKIWISHSP